MQKTHESTTPASLANQPAPLIWDIPPQTKEELTQRLKEAHLLLFLRYDHAAVYPGQRTQGQFLHLSGCQKT